MSAPPTGVLFNEARAKPLSTTGTIQPGAYYQFYNTGTLTLTNVYADGNLATPLSQTPGSGSTTAASDGRLVPIYLNPATTYRYQLYSSTAVLLEDVDPYIPAPVPTQAQIGTVLYPQTLAEIALSVTPTNYFYPADPYVDPRRYGADPTGAVVSTAAVQTAINVAIQANGLVWIGNQCNFLTSALTVSYSGNDFSNGLRIMGSSINGSRLTVSGTPTALLAITAVSKPAGFPLVLENFSIVGATIGAISTIGVKLDGLAQFLIKRICIQGCAYAVQSLSCLTYTIEDCIFSNNSATGSTTAIYIRGASVTANMCKIFRCTISGYATYAIDFDQGAELMVEECDIEACGTHNNSATGGIHIGGNLEPSFGFGKINMRNNWLEGNEGWQIICDAQTGGCSSSISIRGGWAISSLTGTPGQGLLVSGCNWLLIEDFLVPDATGALANLTASFACIRNSSFQTLTDTGITYPTYQNVSSAAGGSQTNGRKDTFTGTLTGISNTPQTGSVNVYQQGNEIMLEFLAQITGNSNSTAATITGLPAKYWPQNDTIGYLDVQDNSANSIRPCSVASATGVITLGSGQTLTNGGTKGVVGGSLRFRKA